MCRLGVFLVAFLLVGCTPVTAVTPYADAVPMPMPEPFACALSGDNAAFTLECVEPTPTPTATPTPSFWYFACSGDVHCTSGQFRVYWDRDLTMLRCALPAGSKVTRIADGYSLRLGEGEALAWVVTGADAGGKPCEGWTPETFLRAAE